jgi:hypothetical protein
MDQHDDGLVHSHGWASEPPRHSQPRPAPAPRPMRGAAPEPRAHEDDGLVHSHGWACSERGRARH